jgi:hypothetical protein
MTSERFFAIELHEFGHALGLPHTATGVMEPHAYEPSFTPDVLIACRNAGACP